MSDPIFSRQPNAAAPKKDEEDGLPDALKGKSKAEIFNSLRAEHIRELAETTQDYTRRLENIALTSPPAPPSQPRQEAPQQEQPVQFDISNPEAYLNDAVARRMAPVVQSMVAAGRESGRSIIQQKLTKEQWDKYGKEIEQIVDGTNPQVQANPKIYDAAWTIVKGQHADELIQEGTKTAVSSAVKQVLSEMGIEGPDVESRLAEREKPREESRPSLFQARTIPSTSTPRSASEATRSVSTKGKLSAEEKHMCEVFEMSPEEYLKYKEENTDLHTQLARERSVS